MKLSQARAQSVVATLIAKYAIPPARLIAFGAGPYAPVASNRTDDGRAKNRRVELVEIATKGDRADSPPRPGAPGASLLGTWEFSGWVLSRYSG